MASGVAGERRFEVGAVKVVDGQDLNGRGVSAFAVDGSLTPEELGEPFGDYSQVAVASGDGVGGLPSLSALALRALDFRGRGTPRLKSRR